MWKDIYNYEGKYIIDNNGNVKNVKSGKVLSPANSGKGYMMLYLIKDGVKERKYIHRIVAESFIPNPNNYKQVNHKDGIKNNNNVENLEWVTPSQNIKHAYREGLKKPFFSGINGKNHPCSKGILQIDKNNNIIKKWENISRASEELNISVPCISMCCNGIRKTAGNYCWKFI